MREAPRYTWGAFFMFRVCRYAATLIQIPRGVLGVSKLSERRIHVTHHTIRDVTRHHPGIRRTMAHVWLHHCRHHQTPAAKQNSIKANHRLCIVPLCCNPSSGAVQTNPARQRTLLAGLLLFPSRLPGNHAL